MKAIALVSIAAVLWGTVGVANRLMGGSPRLDPALAGLSRTALGAACLLAVGALVVAPRPGWRTLPYWALLVFGVAGAVFQTCLFAAFESVGVTVTVAVTVAGPAALVAIGDASWNRRRPEPMTAISIAMASVGLVAALAGDPRQASPGVVGWQDTALLLVAASAFAIVAATARGLGAAVGPLHAAGFGLLVTALALTAVALLRGRVDPGTLAALPARDMAILAYTGVVATGGAYLAFVAGMRLSRTSTTGIAATLIEPGVAALLAALVLHERLSPLQANGCVLMVAAIAFLAVAESRATAG